MSSAPTTVGDLSIAAVVERTRAMLQRHWLRLGAIALGIDLIGTLVWNYASGELPTGTILPSSNALRTPAMLISGAISAFASGAMLHLVLDDRDGTPPTLAEAMATGGRFMVPLMLLGAAIFLGAAAGVILLIVPGVIIMLMWSVAQPVMVAEEVGVTDALRRSRELTKGARRKLLALWAITFVVMIVLLFGAMTLVPSLLGLSGWGAVVPDVLVSLLFSVFITCLQAASYLELRQLKDGVDVGDLAEVFA